MIAAVCDDQPASRYIDEILAHAGLPWRRLAVSDLNDLPPDLRLIVLVGDGQLDRMTRDGIAAFVRAGGALVATGGTWGLDDLLGVTMGRDRRDGYLTATAAAHPITGSITHPLHVFASGAMRATTGTAFARVLAEDGQIEIGDGVVINRPGAGATVMLAPNIPASVLHIQLGRVIHEDGEPAPDGTAPIDDEILKTDDGVVLDWEHDRERTPPPVPVPDCPGKHESYPAGDTPWFAWPVADELSDLLLRAIAWAATATGQLLPVLWVWPRHLPAVGLISHDSDHNVDASAHTALELLARAEISSTWCHMYGPTYPARYERATFDAVRRAGHELALHYNALDHDGGAWGRAQLAAQAAFVRAESGAAGFSSNKNHYLRWEGGVEFYRWLVDEGIQADQTKGPSKKGNVGYPHGSCQPWFPFDPTSGEPIDVVEIPLQFQDLWLTAPAYLAETTIVQARRHHGVAHFLFHQVHLQTKPEVAATMLATIDLGRRQGLEWWTSARINDWERRRRQIRLAMRTTADGGWLLTLTTAQPVPGATIALMLSAGDRSPVVTAGSIPVAVSRETYADLPALIVQIDLPAGETTVHVTGQDAV